MSLFRQQESGHVKKILRMHRMPRSISGHLCTLDFRGQAMFSIGEWDFNGYVAPHARHLRPGHL